MNRRHLTALVGAFISVCGTRALAQVDIYQSDAYSVEEMCAREAEQATETDYSTAYDQCIDKNQNSAMYRPAEEAPEDASEE